MNTYTYELGDNLYINLTNRCNNQCTFCIKFKKRNFEDKFDLWLTKEPTAAQVLEEIPDPLKYKQIVFCGYGESLIRVDTLVSIAKHLKQKGSTIRIDTDGQANLFHGKNILPMLNGLVDEINISLNAQDSELYQKLCLPVYKDKAYQAILGFARLAKDYIPKVILTAVALPSVDSNACKNIAQEIGVEFKARQYYESSYISS